MIDTNPASETLASRAARCFTGYRGGNEAQLGELIDLLTPILWHTVRGQRVEHDLAQDVLQTVWMTLVRSGASIADPQAVLQWLIVAARREAWRVVKKQDRDEPREIEADEVVAAADDAPEAVVLRSDTERRLWAHIQRLPGRCQALLRVIAFADRPDYASVARSLGMPVGSIGPTRGRCLQKLRTTLGTDPGWAV